MKRSLAALAVATLFVIGCSESSTGPSRTPSGPHFNNECVSNASNNPPTTASNNCTNNNNNNNNNTTNNDNNPPKTAP